MPLGLFVGWVTIVAPPKFECFFRRSRVRFRGESSPEWEEPMALVVVAGCVSRRKKLREL
jgi:hypothetical protein